MQLNLWLTFKTGKQLDTGRQSDLSRVTFYLQLPDSPLKDIYVW